MSIYFCALRFNPIDEDEQQEAALEANITNSDNSSRASTPTTGRKGATAKKLGESNEILSRIEKKMDQRHAEKRSHREDVLRLYQNEVEESKKFRLELLETKKERNHLLKLLLEKK